MDRNRESDNLIKITKKKKWSTLCDEILTDLEALANHISLGISLVAEQKIKKVMKDFKLKRSCGYHQISNLFLKEFHLNVPNG